MTPDMFCPSWTPQYGKGERIAHYSMWMQLQGGTFVGQADDEVHATS